MVLMDFDNFYGRDDALDLLKKRVLDLKEGYRQNIAFVGEQYIGKSVLLQKFISELDDDKIIPVYLDLENKDFNSFCYKFIGSLLYSFSKSKKLPLYNQIPLLVESVQKEIPLTVKSIQKIKSLLNQKKIVETYREVISLSQIFTKETDLFCLLIFDEFHILEDFSIPDVFKELGKKIMTQKQCLYVVSSSFPGTAHKILSEKLSLLFGNFEVVHVEPFDLKTSHQYIKHHLTELRMSESLCNFFVDFTGGHPLYLKLICQQLKDISAIYHQKEIYMPLFLETIEKVLFDPWGILSRHFDLLIHRIGSGKGNQSMMSILIALSNKKQKIKSISEELKFKQTQISLKINRLCEAGIVIKNGSYYYLRDKLLKYWIKYVFQRKHTAFDFSWEDQRKAFREELSQAFEGFQNNAEKDIPSRIIDLLYCFEEEIFHINGRRYKLPLFEKIIPTKLRKMSGEYFDIIHAMSAQGVWFIAVKNEIVQESDINTILSESKKMEQKPQKCILISLADLDENVRVKALQEKMWIWNEGEINTLLNLYNKPYIVR